MRKNKKIKVFLGGYINSINAQNLNCRALAQHLNKERFEVYTMSLHAADLPLLQKEGVKYFHCFRPHKLSAYWAYLRGICVADVVYLPKGELPSWTMFLLSFLKKRNFTTLEGIIDEEAIVNAKKVIGEDYVAYFHKFQKRYSITDFMRQYNEKRHGIQTEEKTLYLGTEPGIFKGETREQQALKKVVMVGNDLVRKGIHDYLKIAEALPQLEFHLAGSGNDKIDVAKTIEDKGLSNVHYHGMISQEQLAKLFKEAQLHVFPSRSEGFPKVTLEAASAGVPSLVYADYGAAEWISHGINGFVVNTLDEMISELKKIEEDQEQLLKMAHAAVALGESFDWKERVSDWEEVIEELAKSKR